jgi:hypothetical protein
MLRNPLLAAMLFAPMAALPAWGQVHKDIGGTVLQYSGAPIYLYNSAGANTHQQLTITSGAVVSLTVPVGATIIAYTLEIGSIRMLDDGTNPTTSLGNLWLVGPGTYSGPLSAARFIAVSTTATLDVLYYFNN